MYITKPINQLVAGENACKKKLSAKCQQVFE